MKEKVRMAVMMDPKLKQAVKDYGALPEVERDMSWLVVQWIKEGLARAERNDG